VFRVGQLLSFPGVDLEKFRIWAFSLSDLGQFHEAINMISYTKGAHRQRNTRKRHGVGHGEGLNWLMEA